MKKKLMSAITFGLAFISPILITASETSQPDPEELNVPQLVRAKDGENGASGGLITDGLNGQDGQKGKNGQDGGKGGNGGNSWFGRGGNGGNGGDSD